MSRFSIESAFIEDPIGGVFLKGKELLEDQNTGETGSFVEITFQEHFDRPKSLKNLSRRKNIPYPSGRNMI